MDLFQPDRNRTLLDEMGIVWHVKHSNRFASIQQFATKAARLCPLPGMGNERDCRKGRNKMVSLFGKLDGISPRMVTR